MFRHAAKEATERRDLAEQWTGAMIELMEREGSNWKQPWTGGGLHRSAVTKLPYRGFNQFALMNSSAESAWHATYKGWTELGAQVRKGEKARYIFFWKPLAVRDKETDEEKQILMSRTYPVFSADQVDNPPPLTGPTRTPIERDAEADRLLAEIGSKISYGGDRAFYSLAADQITLPKPEQFKDRESFYSVGFHEGAHATCHPTRLNRELGKRFGDKAYAIEELIAECSTALTCVSLGIIPQPRRQSAQYMNNWVAALREDKRVIISVFSKAQAATDYILGAGRPDQPPRAKEVEARL